MVQTNKLIRRTRSQRGSEQRDADKRVAEQTAESKQRERERTTTYRNHIDWRRKKERG